MSIATLDSANYYVVLGLDEALDPVADNVRLRKIIEERAAEAVDPYKAASSGARARAGLVGALAAKMLGELGPAGGGKSAPDPIWTTFHSAFQEALGKERTRLKTRANAVFEILGEQEVARSVAKRIVSELGDQALVDEIIAARKIRIADNKANPAITPAFLGTCKSARIKVLKLVPYLEIFGVPDIYVLLARMLGLTLSPASTNEEMAKAVQQLRKVQTDVGNKKLTGPVREIETLLTDLHKVQGQRAIVDDFIKLEGALPFFAVVKILKSVEMVRRDHVDRIVSVGAARTGLQPERVLLLLKALMQDDGIPVDTWGLVDHYRVCGVCGALNRASDMKCIDCKSALFARCANCNTQFDSAAQLCPACGTTAADGRSGQAALARAEWALVASDSAAMDMALREATHLIPRSSALGPLTTRLAQLREAAGKEEARLVALVTSERRMWAALGEISKKPAGLTQATLDRLRRTAEAALAEAAELTAEARALIDNGDFGAAERSLKSALERVTDDSAARNLLDTIPPPAPAALHARVGDESVNLSWSASQAASEKLEFVVRRSADGPLRNSTEGTEIARTSDLAFEDRTCPPGRRIHYAVFSRRGKAISQGAARAANVLLLASVGALKAEADESCVRLTWTLPPGAREAEIRRARPEDNDAAVLAQAALAHVDSTWTDESPHTGQLFRYHVTACYGGPDGSTLRAPARTVLGSVVLAPTRIRSFYQDNDLAMLRWQDAPLPGEEDKVLVVPAGMTLPAPDTLVDWVDLAGVPDLPVAGRQTLVPVSKLPFGRHRIAVVRRREAMARIGPTLTVPQLMPLGEVGIAMTATGAEVTWIWPDGCRRARLRVRIDQLAEQDIEVRREGADPKGHQFIAASPPSDVTVEVHGVAEDGTAESAMVTRTVRMVRQNRLFFAVTRHRPRLFGRSSASVGLRVWLDHAEPFPEYELRFHPDFPPQRGDGECLYTSRNKQPVSTPQETDITRMVGDRLGFVGLILVQPGDAERFQVVPADNEIC